MDSLSDIIHKEKKQKKNNKAKGQLDNLDKIRQPAAKVNTKKATEDKQIRREAQFIKNIHIDELLGKLYEQDLLRKKYHNWYAKCIHQLGVTFVRAQADKCLNDEGVRNPQALFHFLLNKEMSRGNQSRPGR